MGALKTSFLFDFESNMQTLVENEYSRLTSNLWWPNVAKVRPSESRAERIGWLLSTAQIRPEGKGGNINFQDLVSQTKEYVNRNSGAGLKLTKNQLTDNEKEGYDFAQQWSADIGAYMAYWPQKQATLALLNGGAATSLAYDGSVFFGSHPLNPYRTTLGTYKNVFTGGASGSYPGACPIDETNAATVDIAVKNLGKAIAYIRSIRMPNGEDPRYLEPKYILGAPALTARLQQVTNAKFIAQAAATGGGSGDIEALIKNWGMAEPVMAPELAAAGTYALADEDGGGTVSGNDTTYYIICEQASTSQLGGLVYVEREPFAITYYTGSGSSTGIDAILDRARELEWHCQGRNVLGYGHPFLVFQCQGT